MFTGIVQSLGSINTIDKDTNIYTIKTNLNLQNCNNGSSICCDGVCLTAFNIVKLNEFYLFNVNVGEETLNRSNLIYWNKNKIINIEQSLRIGGEISGHFVYGHVDTFIKVKKINKLSKSWEFLFLFNNFNNIKKMIVEKGSVTINGVSLTVSNVLIDCFSVSIIPYTFENTNLSSLHENDFVNIEFDPLARYISKYYEK